MNSENRKAKNELATAKAMAIKSEIGNLAKGSFIATLSHELRVPMNSVMGMLRLLKDTELNKRQEEYLNLALEASEYLLVWIREITRVSSRNTEEFKIEDQPFDLFRAGKDVIKTFSGEVAAKKINLQYQYEVGTPTLLNGDVLKIQQILAKLIENAIHFTDQGSVKLQIRSCGKQDWDVVIEFKVTDTGVGISQEKIDTIFDFSNERIATNPIFQKISLELAVCKKIVEAMNGTLKLSSKKNEGTEFTIKIPLPETPPELIEAIAAEAEEIIDISSNSNRSFKGIKVLLAEDDTINQNLAVAFLHKLGGEIDTADNGKQAVEKYKNGSYDIIFMDCEMPKMDGYEATRAIRKLEKKTNTHIPILAMTAYAGRGDREHCLSAGMDGHIPKPITVDVLEDVVQKFIVP